MPTNVVLSIRKCTIFTSKPFKCTIFTSKHFKCVCVCVCTRVCACACVLDTQRREQTYLSMF